MNSVQGQKAIITGATRGIGKAIAEKFLEHGIYVIGVYGGNSEAAKIFAEQNRRKDYRAGTSRYYDAGDGRGYGGGAAAVTGKIKKYYRRLCLYSLCKGGSR